MAMASVVSLARRVLDAPTFTHPTRGIAMIIGACAIYIGIGFAGPSAVAITLGPRTSWLPPWYLPVGYANWNEWIVVPAIWVAILLGAVGLWTCWRALDGGWRPHPWRLLGLGSGLCAGVGAVLPLTSADVLMYAAYGRLQVLGQNPYDITPAMIIRQEYDPVLRWIERPWTDTPSVYGPLASACQWLASVLGGDNMHATVFWLQLMTTIPFIAVAVITMLMVRGDRLEQTRAALLIVLNPLMIGAIVAGAHNEALTMLFAVAGVYFMRRNPVLAGLGIGLAGTIKVSLVFYGLAMFWTYRRDWRRMLGLLVGAAVPLVFAYVVWAPETVLAAQRNTSYLSAGSWLSSVGMISAFFGVPVPQAAFSWTGWIAMALIAWMLSRVLPHTRLPGGDPALDGHADPLSATVRTIAILVCAWLLTSPYTWVWYDLLAWVPLALVVSARLNAIMTWRAVWLSLAYVTGRVYPYGDQMLAVMSALRDGVCTIAQIMAVAAVVVWWWREGHELPPLAKLVARLRGHPHIPHIPHIHRHPADSQPG